MAEQLLPDQKEIASTTLGDVIRRTHNNFPDARFRPVNFREGRNYNRYGIDTHGFLLDPPNADGIGTKPELAERLFSEDRNPNYFEGLAFDTFSMIDGDVARFGAFLIGIVNTIDVNTADPDVVMALARGAEKACNTGRFPLFNGETAELGYRSSGYGDIHVNWNAAGISLQNPDKELTGEGLVPDQPIVVFREKGIRSNGLTRARAIAEAQYLSGHGYVSKEGFVTEFMRKNGFLGGEEFVLGQLNNLFGHDVLEQVLLPWHKENPSLATSLLTPSTIYGPILYDAQGGIDGERQVDLVAASHITGGGIPLKGRRMVEEKGLGLSLDSVFPEPEPITRLLEVHSSLPVGYQNRITMNDRVASEQWNRGIGFIVVTRDIESANRLIEISNSHNVEAAVAGKVIDKPEIQFRGHTWKY